MRSKRSVPATFSCCSADTSRTSKVRAPSDVVAAPRSGAPAYDLYAPLLHRRDQEVLVALMLENRGEQLDQGVPADGLWQEKIDQHSTGTVSTVWQVSWEDGQGGGGSDE